MNLLETYDELSALNESPTYSAYEPINLEAFENGTNNVLYIVGMPGSGKSTLADMLAEQYGAKIINLDNGWLGGIVNVTDEELEISWFDEEFWRHFPKYRITFDNVCKYVNEHPEDPYAAENCPDADSVLGGTYYTDYIKYAIEYANSHKQEKFIIEGVQLLDRDSAGYLHRALMGPNPSILFMRTKSKRVTRNIRARDKAWGLKPRDPKELHKQNMKWKKEIDDFRKEFKGE